MKQFELHPETPQSRYMREIADHFLRGDLLIFPSDSGYTLGCSALSHRGLRRIYQLKKSSKKYQMALLFHEFGPISEFAQLDNSAFKYMKPLVPGPYTFLLPATNRGKKLLEVRRQEIGVRLPDTPFLKSLRIYCTEPIITTTPKNGEEEVPTQPSAIDPRFLNAVDAVADMGEIPANPSTIVSLLGGEPELIREGAGQVY